MVIQRFTPQELLKWTQSPKYQQLSVVPVSPQRAQSYVQNPRGRANDIVAYLAWEDEELVGFRTVVADHILQPSLVRFAWLSGVWVSPNNRRKGIASRLLEAVHDDWGGLLMTSNNSPASRKVYLQSGHFDVYHRQPGKRFYLRFSLHRLLPPRHPIFHRLRGVLRVGDTLFNLLHDRKLLILRFLISTKGIPFDAYPNFPNSWDSFISTASQKNLSCRSIQELRWISEYPWVISSKEAQASYPFSSHAYPRKLWHLGLKNEAQEQEAWLELSLMEKVLAIPFYFGPQAFHEHSSLGENLRTLILHYMVSWKCNTLTVYHPSLLELLEEVKGVFLYSRPFEQIYLATTKLIPHLPAPEALVFQDGEGDACFTATG